MPPSRGLLTRPHPPEFLHQHLRSADDWQPSPTANDRSAWAKVPAHHRATLIAEGEKMLVQPWAALPASLWLGYVRTGDRAEFQAACFGRRQQLIRLVFAECLEGQGRFTEAVADGLWLICEETSWCLPAHLRMQTRGYGLPDHLQSTVDLFAAETAALLAWIDWLLRTQLDAVHPLLRERLRFEVDRRVITPCLERDDFWWMGWHRGTDPINNWNPWCNSNWLTCVLLLESDHDRRTAAVHKILRSLEAFVDFYPADGGCDEGPTYWGRAGASLFDCLELLHSATAGKIDLYAEPLVQEMARYVMRAHIGEKWLLNFADAGARGAVEGLLVWRFGQRIKDPTLAAFGAWQHQHNPAAWVGLITSPGRLIANLQVVAEVETAPAAAPLLRDVWLPDLQVFVARDAGGTTNGFYLAAKGGHNNESHNHNDVGSFVVYLDGEPLLIDLGVETYSARTFNAERYQIWTMQSQWHNLPTVNGTMQENGPQFSARVLAHQADEATASLTLDISAAYPADAAITRWTRSLRLTRGRHIVLTDDYELYEARTPTVYNFICHQRPEVLPNGVVLLCTAHGGRLEFDFSADELLVDIAETAVTDPQLKTAWGDRVYRLRLTESKLVRTARREFRFVATPTTPKP
ncbi:MAG: heparinase II/III-family protein [Cephaloticoccus sp.]|nr:heparinase II/III-family protein [Cephaloticoccus sp.]